MRNYQHGIPSCSCSLHKNTSRFLTIHLRSPYPAHNPKHLYPLHIKKILNFASVQCPPRVLCINENADNAQAISNLIGRHGYIALFFCTHIYDVFAHTYDSIHHHFITYFSPLPSSLLHPKLTYGPQVGTYKIHSSCTQVLQVSGLFRILGAFIGFKTSSIHNLLQIHSS